ncbi:MAG: hypothetical protein Fur0025_12120 [Oscillatoriaceae cyanobacterium]
MINDREFLHGAAFLKLIEYGHKISINHIPSIHQYMYLIDTDTTKAAIMFKVSKKPTSAWSFTLSPEESLALRNVETAYPAYAVFLALVCHKDGICCISQKRLQFIIDTDTAVGSQHLSVARKPHGNYHVSGGGRQKMDRTVPPSDWPRLIFNPSHDNYE